jgi:hypothetical protein
MKTSKPIGLPEAAGIIGKDVQWLRRLLLKREREIGQRIMVRVGDGPSRTRYLISLSALRQVEPSLFDAPTETEVQMREALDGFSARMDEVEECIERMQASIGELADSIRDAVRKHGRGIGTVLGKNTA